MVRTGSTLALDTHSRQLPVRHRRSWVDYLGIGLHLANFMLVAKLEAPDWAKAAGYGWIILDVATGVMTLNDVPQSTALYIRLAGHIFTGIWIATVSLRGPIIMKKSSASPKP